MAADCKLVVHNGRVMDPETSFDAVRNGDVKGGVAAIIEEPIKSNVPFQRVAPLRREDNVDEHALRRCARRGR